MRIRSIRDSERNRRTTSDVPSGTEATTTPATSLSEREAAEYIGMSRAWLKKSRTQRLRGLADAPPFVRCGARRVVYRRDDLDAWQRRHVEHVGPARAEPHGCLTDDAARVSTLLPT